MPAAAQCDALGQLPQGGVGNHHCKAEDDGCAARGCAAGRAGARGWLGLARSAAGGRACRNRNAGGKPAWSDALLYTEGGAHSCQGNLRPRFPPVLPVNAAWRRPGYRVPEGECCTSVAGMSAGAGKGSLDTYDTRRPVDHPATFQPRELFAFSNAQPVARWLLACNLSRHTNHEIGSPSQPRWDEPTGPYPTDHGVWGRCVSDAVPNGPLQPKADCLVSW